MAKLNPQARAALQSARAKNRKAVVILGNAAQEHGVKVPKNIVAKMQALESWYDTLLAAKKTTPNTDGGATPTDEAENSGAELDAVAA